MEKFKLTLILKNGRTIVLTSAEEKEEVTKIYDSIMDDLKKSFAFIKITTDTDKVVVATDELAAVMVSPTKTPNDHDKELTR